MKVLGKRLRDANGKSAKDHILELWVKKTMSGEELDAEAYAQQFDVKASTIRRWISCWHHYDGTRFTGTEGWPRVTHSMLNTVITAIRKSQARG